MKKQYDVHADFAKFPVFNFSFNPLLMGLANAVMKTQRFFGKPSPDMVVGKHTLSTSDGGAFDVITLTPQGLKKPAPALIYYHGGAFALGYASSHTKGCERYAREAACTVVFVDYRLAPKFPFPCGFNDCYQALEWVVDQADTLGVDINRIAVGGDSAGGALAAGVAQKARDEQFVEPCAQLLIYPVLDNSCSTPSATDFVDVPLWNATSNRRMWDMYLCRYGKGETPPYAAPGLGQLQNLPRSFVETAEFDPLRDEGLEYARALQAQGIDVTLNETKQTVHGYDSMAGSEISRRSMSKRIEFLSQAFNTPGV